MQISFERSGGIAGILMHTDLDTKDLTPAEAARVTKLVEQAKFFELPRSTPPGPGADRFQYKITVKQGDQRKTVTVSDGAMPAALKPLVTMLTERARGRP
jgi:hypothetical protein